MVCLRLTTAWVSDFGMLLFANWPTQKGGLGDHGRGVVPRRLRPAAPQSRQRSAPTKIWPPESRAEARPTLRNCCDKGLNCAENRLNLQLHSWSAARWRALFSHLAGYRNPGRSAIALWPRAALRAKHSFTSNSLAAYHGGGRGCQGGAQQGTRARGEQYLDSPARSHTLAAPELLEVLLPAVRPLDSSRSVPRDVPRPPN